jgi:hypothetical protein
MKTYGGVDVQIPIFSTSALVEGEWSASRPSRFILRRKATVTHWIRGWVGLRVCMDNLEKRNFLPLPELELRPLGPPVRSQSLYRVRYPDSVRVNYSLYTAYLTRIVLWISEKFIYFESEHLQLEMLYVTTKIDSEVTVQNFRYGHIDYVTTANMSIGLWKILFEFLILQIYWSVRVIHRFATRH